jgi:hypothetical protein
MLLDGKGKAFITHYHDYVDKIYNYNIPLVKIASKSKVKCSIPEYKVKANKKNKDGNPMPKQAHMELALRHDLNVNLGDTIYYVNTGKGKTQGDIKTLNKSKMTKRELETYFNANGHYPKFETETQINCQLIDSLVVDSNLEMIKEIETLKKLLVGVTDEDKINEINSQIEQIESGLLTDDYNVAKYLESFNKKVKPLLVCFHSDIRDRILLTIKKDKKTKLEKLTDKNIFTEEQCTLVSGMPNKSTDQDTYEELMTMEDKEIRFWDSVNKVPNNMDENDWYAIRDDYRQRMIIERENGIKFELDRLDSIFKQMEINELDDVSEKLILPKEILIIATVNEGGYFISRKWGAQLYHVNEMFKYENEAIERSYWYKNTNKHSDNRYELWLEYKSEQSIEIGLGGEQLSSEDILSLKENIAPIETQLKLKPVKQKKETDNDDEDDDGDEEDDTEELDVTDEFIPELERIHFEIETKSFTPDTEPAAEVDYVKVLMESLKTERDEDEEDDEWNF